MEQNNCITKIRDSYTAHADTKLDELKALDKKVKLFPTVFAYVSGVVALLILGVGMCLAMKVIGASVMSATASMAVGVVVGCVGIALSIANYYVYNLILKSRKAKYADRIITLSNVLLNN